MKRVHNWVHAGILAGWIGAAGATAHAQQPAAPAAPPAATPAPAAPAVAPAVQPAPSPPVAEPAPVAPPAPVVQSTPVDQGVPPAPAAKPSSSVSSLEVFGALGTTALFGEPANPEYADSFQRTGGFGEIGIAYRSNYFIDPHISFGYASLASGVAHLPAGEWGPAGDLEQHLGSWFFSPGITAEVWRFRFRLGIGIAVIDQSFTYQGQESSSSQIPILNEFGVGFVALDVPRFRLDVEVRDFAAPGADLNFLTLNVVARGDVIEFGR